LFEFVPQYNQHNVRVGAFGKEKKVSAKKKRGKIPREEDNGGERYAVGISVAFY
jgi:hypothetical protein